MNIFLTYDYELFFGENPGTVQKCMLEPTQRLLEMAGKYKAKITFFVDVGFLIKLDEYRHTFSELDADFLAVKDQIERIIDHGHSVQLHIHPHWEKSEYKEGKWHINTSKAYKLSDFPQNEIDSIIQRYKAFLDGITGESTTVFRAGGWCVQPFHLLERSFKELGIRIDSSVFPGGKMEAGEYAFDFTGAPMKDFYRFSNDVCVEDPSGYFCEYPISSWRYSPLFYWKLYILGRLNPHKHKMLGDGNFLAQPGRKRSTLFNFTWNHVSTDGYYAAMLHTQLKQFTNMGRSNMVVIGHPKGMTNYSFERLEKFLRNNSKTHAFLALTSKQCA